MKFMYFFLPTLPATPAERRALRPIAHHTERWQQLFEEVVEVTRLAEDLGFDAVCFPEHHLHRACRRNEPQYLRAFQHWRG